MTINDFRFRGKIGRPWPMAVYRGTNQATIANYSFWMGEYRKDETSFLGALITTINHESLHKILFHVKGQMASKAIDKRNIFGTVETQDIIGIKVPVDDEVVPA